LLKYGYLEKLEDVKFLFKPSCALNEVQIKLAQQIYRKAICNFQRYARLPVTGEFDSITRSKMNVPRCGVQDELRRYAVAHGLKWRKQNVTYRISQFSQSNFPRKTIVAEIDKAFLMWSNVTNLCFVKDETAKEVDIEIQFTKQEHGDLLPFEGPGEALAHVK